MSERHTGVETAVDLLSSQLQRQFVTSWHRDVAAKKPRLQRGAALDLLQPPVLRQMSDGSEREGRY